MASCLDNIVTTGYCGTTPTSGLTLKDAPEISTLNLENIANEDSINGKALAESKLTLAQNLIKNDLMAIMSTNNVLPNVNNTIYNTGTFNLNTTIQSESIERGLALITNPQTRGKLRKTTIHSVRIYPLAAASNVALRVYDDYAGGIVSEYRVNLAANDQNVYDIEYAIKGNYARVVFDGNAIILADSALTTCAGCSGMMPNDCAYTKASYNGKDVNGKSGYGVLLDYSCKCDYDELMCGLSTQFIGQLIWYKARILLMESLLMSNRENNWVIFNTDAMAQYLATVKNDYQNTWTTFSNSLPQTLKQYQDSCLNCRGVSWKYNI